VDSFSGKVIPVTGPNALEPKELAWFSEVRIFKSTKSGDYDAHIQHPTNGDDVDAAIRAALRTVIDQLNAKT
jgi:hypothetical protein